MNVILTMRKDFLSNQILIVLQNILRQAMRIFTSVIFTFIFVIYSAFTQPDAQTYYESGLKNLSSTEYVKAIGDFTNAISMKSDFGDAFLKRAIAKELLAEKVGFDNSELCFDAVMAMRLGNKDATTLLCKKCITQCFDQKTAYFEPEIVFCADLSSKVLSDMPEGSADFANIVKLNLFNNKFTTLTPVFEQLSSLVLLDMSSNRLTDLGKTVGFLVNLEELNLNKNSLTTIPADFSKIKKLKKLYLRSNALTEFPTSILTCTELEDLDLSLNQFTSVPADIKNLKKLKTLNLVGNNLSGKNKKEISAALPSTTIYFE